MHFFLDWCPRATNAIDPITFSLENKTKSKIDEIVRMATSDNGIHCHLVECHYRNDGIILFSFQILDTAGEIAELPYEDLISLAAIISNNVKSLIGHTHVYDTDYCERGKKVRFPSVSKHPVLVNELDGKQIDSKDLSQIIANNNSLASLYSLNKNGEKRRSILLVRERFSKIFDKSFIAISQVKRHRLFGAPTRLRYFDYVLLILIVSAVFSMFHFMPVDKILLLATGTVNVITAIFFYVLYNYMHYEHFVKFLKDHIFNDTVKEIAKRVKFSVSKAFFSVFNPDLIDAMKVIFCSNFVKSIYSRVVFSVAILSPILLSCDLLRPFFPMTQKFFHLLSLEAEYYSVDGVLTSFTYKRFSYWWVSNISVVIWTLPVFMFAFEISFKRRKVLQILERAKGMMEFGSIYNGVVQNILSSATQVNDYSGLKFQNFDYAISIVASRMNIEKKKRYKFYFWYMVILCFSVLLLAYDYFLNGFAV